MIATSTMGELHRYLDVLNDKLTNCWVGLEPGSSAKKARKAPILAYKYAVWWSAMASERLPRRLPRRFHERMALFCWSVICTSRQAGRRATFPRFHGQLSKPLGTWALGPLGFNLGFSAIFSLPKRWRHFPASPLSGRRCDPSVLLCTKLFCAAPPFLLVEGTPMSWCKL